jgi:hypothetical protein
LIDPEDSVGILQLSQELPSWQAAGELFQQSSHLVRTVSSDWKSSLEASLTQVLTTLKQVQNTTEDLGRNELLVPRLFFILPKLRTKRFKISLRNTMIILFICPIIDGKIARYEGRDGLKFKLPNEWLNAFVRFRQNHPILMSLSALALSLVMKLFTGCSILDLIPSNCLNEIEKNLSVIEFIEKYYQENFKIESCFFENQNLELNESSSPP